MTYMDLQALRHYVRQVQKIIYETRSCIIIGCDKCECAYILRINKLLAKAYAARDKPIRREKRIER